MTNGGPNGSMMLHQQQQLLQDPTEMQNERAIEVLDRVAQKLTGRDFKPEEELDVISQVNKLIMEATKLENLCQHYIGWCSFW
jgi:FKBP12-rapamycin complex-associated protein